jgi:chromosome segregation ATPase
MSQTLKQINTELDQIEEALDGLNNRKSEIDSILPGIISSYNSWKAAEDSRRATYRALKEKRDGGYCAAQFSNSSKRSDCQSQLNSQTATALASLTEASNKRAARETTKNELSAELEGIEERIAARKDRQKTLMQQANDIGDRDLELASQGTTSDALAIVANAEAQAEAIKAQAEAQGTIEERRSSIATKEDQQKVILYVGIGVGVLILIAGVLILRKKFKKNKKK